jgi:hypothetical protein
MKMNNSPLDLAQVPPFRALGSPPVAPLLQTPIRGTLEDEYQIYRQAAKDLGWSLKSYDDWLST